MGVAASSFSPPLNFTDKEQDKYTDFIDRKADARRSLRKAVVQNVYAPTSGEKLHKTARLCSETDLGLTAIRFLVESGFETAQIADILRQPSEHATVWNKFKTSRQARSAVNQFDYLYTHTEEIPKGGLSKMVKASRFLRLFGDLLIARTSLTTRTVRSVTGTSEKTSVYSTPLFFGSAMLTNFMGVALRNSAKVITSTIISVLVFSAAALTMSLTRVAAAISPKKSLTNNDLKIAAFRANELIENLAKTSYAQQSKLSKQQSEVVRSYVDEKIAYTENTLHTRLSRRFVTGDYRASCSASAAELKRAAARGLLNLPTHRSHVLGVIEQIRASSENAKEHANCDLASYHKGQDYVFQGVRAVASLVTGPQRGAQKLVVPALEYRELTRLKSKLELGEDADLIKEKRAQIEERLDWQYTSHLAKRSYLFKKKLLDRLANRVAVRPLNVSSTSVRTNRIDNWRQQYARWLTYDPKGNKDLVKTFRAFESCPSKRHRRAKTLHYAAENIREYGKVTQFLLSVGKASEEFSWKFALPMTGHASRFVDKYIFKMLKHEQGIITRSTWAHGGGASIWVGLNLLAFPPMAILFGGIDLFTILSTTALGAAASIPAIVAYSLAYPLIHVDWKGPA